MGVLDLAKTTTDSAAEVPIPVLTNVSNIKRPYSLDGNGDPLISATPKQALPTIAVYKPPAPLPVVLPTSSDIVQSPSPTDSLPDDLESGRGPMMQEIGHPPDAHPLAVPQREGKSKKLSATVRQEATLVPLPVAASLAPIAEKAEAADALADLTDLLTDSPPILDPTSSLSPIIPPALSDAGLALALAE